MSFVIDAFLKYIHIPSASDENSEASPSTKEQLVLADILAKDMRDMGITDARSDKDGYVYGSIPANVEGKETVGLIAHLDVVSETPCAPMHERIVEKYDGGTIVLNENISMSADEYSFLKECIGKDIIVTDGNTILGGDDKAGVAEILAVAKRLLEDKSIPHGKVAIAFTPDEEIGGGADKLDLAAFGAAYAYTVDGGGLGDIEYENFNAASAMVTIKGIQTHPGGAKGKMRNAALLAAKFACMLPESETPEHTEGREGFYHLLGGKSKVDEATLVYILRDHDADKLEERKKMLERCAAFINAQYGEEVCTVTIKDSYRNMLEVMKDNMHVIERAVKAHEKCGVKPSFSPVRGGTDGASLSWRGLPCPNLSTGAAHGHSVRECACVQYMEKMVDILTELVRAE